MRSLSHQCLGQYLADHFMIGIRDRHIKAFLFGCIQPDRNPATYLKGSVRCQWLRGHNYPNAQRFMRRISRRLENKSTWNLYDYYTLGKLIHYTTDAFTYAHNGDFPPCLNYHMEYEAILQEHFLSYMAEDPLIDITLSKNIFHTIYRYHQEYEQAEHSVRKDSRYALAACCCVMAVLFAKPFL